MFAGFQGRGPGLTIVVNNERCSVAYHDGVMANGGLVFKLNCCIPGFFPPTKINNPGKISNCFQLFLRRMRKILIKRDAILLFSLN
jgi:hypothetical protein